MVSAPLVTTSDNDVKIILRFPNGQSSDTYTTTSTPTTLLYEAAQTQLDIYGISTNFILKDANGDVLGDTLANFSTIFTNNVYVICGVPPPLDGI